MRPNEDGVYRWRYSLNLYRNAVLLWLFYKVFSCIFAVCVLFGLWLNDFKFSREATKWVLVGYAVMIALVTVSYYLYALIQGGRYTWDFEMDENGVNAVQVANEAKRNKVLGTVVAAMGVASGNLSQIGLGTTVAACNGMYSEFATTRKVKPDRKHNTINIRNGMYHNQVFAADEDFDFVLNFITSHCPKLKGSA